MASEQAKSGSFGVRTVQGLFVALFLAVISAPTVQERTQLLSYQPVVENRTKAPRPEGIFGIFNSESGFAQKYEVFYNDSYGLRDFFIKLKNQLDMWIFKTSDEVLIGEDGWLFYRKLYERDMRLLEGSADRVPMIVERLAQFNRALQQQGVTLILVPCPAKTTLYREHVPARYPVAPNQTAFQEYRRLLRNHPEITVVDVQGILEQLKPRMRVFHKTDFHWNDPAGAVVWKELYKRLAALAGQPEPTLPRVSIVKQRGASGGENNSLAVFFPATEIALNLRAPLAIAKGKLESTKDPNRWDYAAPDPSSSKLLPPTVLIGDSFSDAFLRAGFAASFSRLSKFSNHDFATAAVSLPTGTRFVILEHIESALLGMTLDAWWPRPLLSTIPPTVSVKENKRS